MGLYGVHDIPPVPREVILPCKHKFVHLETTKEKPHGIPGTYSYTDWKRVDRFFCEKCLEVAERKKTASGREDQPDWF